MIYVSSTCHPRGVMQKKLTITIDEKVYEGLYRVVGAGRISQFIERLVRPHVLQHELEAAYAQMAQDDGREEEALAWSEALIADTKDETW
jgi:predicted CopG family antitoxin